MKDFYNRFAQGSIALSAAVIDLGAVFDWIDWSQDQLAAVNLVIIGTWSVVFGTQVRSLKES
tara:strand:- start:3081 stop:3266 length:186 start_codon:yes stop_codon:yes gene_type:complete